MMSLHASCFLFRKRHLNESHLFYKTNLIYNIDEIQWPTRLTRHFTSKCQFHSKALPLKLVILSLVHRLKWLFFVANWPLLTSLGLCNSSNHFPFIYSYCIVHWSWSWNGMITYKVRNIGIVEDMARMLSIHEEVGYLFVCPVWRNAQQTNDLYCLWCSSLFSYIKQRCSWKG